MLPLAAFTVCTPEYTPEAVLPFLQRAGCQGVEWRVGPAAPATAPAGMGHGVRYWAYNRCTLDVAQVDREARRLAPLCADHGLAVPMLGTALGAAEAPDLERCLEAARVFGCPAMRVWLPKWEGRGAWQELFARGQEALHRMVELARPYGVRLCLENHAGTLYPSASALAHVLEPFDPREVGAIYDPGNMVADGYEDYALGLARLGPFLAHVHLKNAAWERRTPSTPDEPRWGTRWCRIDEGSAHLARFSQALLATGYRGWVSIEDFSDDLPTDEKLPFDAAYIRRLGL